MRNQVRIITLLTIFGVGVGPSQAGPNDFFGNPPIQAPGAIAFPGDDSPTMAPAKAAARELGGGSDYTQDEKRVQKKYRASITHARQLVAKGDQMIKEGQERKDDKEFKKGKILKEIGEKQLVELKANNPNGNDEKEKVTKPKTTKPNEL